MTSKQKVGLGLAIIGLNAFTGYVKDIPLEQAGLFA